jgi:hypothetical protein
MPVVNEPDPPQQTVVEAAVEARLERPQRNEAVAVAKQGPPQPNEVAAVTPTVQELPPHSAAR